MNGAREYAGLFKNGQHGRLCFISGSHARGKTFQIWVLPAGFVMPPGSHPGSFKDAVEVYGVTGGQPGWTETYGWLHRGKWEQDFAALVDARRAEIEEEKRRRVSEAEKAAAAEKSRVASLLASY